MWREFDSGPGLTVEQGDRVVYEWEGYTIGYFGRPFEVNFFFKRKIDIRPRTA